jgi:acylphosphatase
MVVHIAYKITVHGFVQGVSFRHEARKEALKLGLRGSVKNKNEDCVEIIAVGLIDDLDAFVKWCHAGPDISRVDFVDVEIIDVKDNFKDFKIIF